ncbi:MAG: hypothetical protein C4557_09590 [Anaerolineaceae bacterium]|jgi:hypothetical protein|nr:MAG: hypothetical protein C4557_09590 [Anaerolineaceae bacterium]
MFDNLREDAAAQSFYEEEAQFQPAAGTEQARKSGSSRFLGMTPIQRFVIAVMMMFAVCVIGALCLLVTEKIMF